MKYLVDAYKIQLCQNQKGDQLLKISKKHIDEMIGHAFDENPYECCGILAGKSDVISGLYRITNTTRSPYRYVMDAQEFLNADKDAEDKGWEILAFYHSHTHSPAYPSQTDVRMALESGWLDVYYILVSLEEETNPQVRAFHIAESGDIIEEEFQLELP